MNGKKQARLVERRHGYEIWDIGNGRGIYVRFWRRPIDTRKPETIALPLDLHSRLVEDWDKLGTWYEDATGGKAVRELGYEPIEEDGNDTD